MSMKKGGQSPSSRSSPSPSPLPFKMTLNKSSQKRLRNDEESEDILPSTKRREYFFSSCPYQCSGDDGSDGAGESSQTQVASTSCAYEGQDCSCSLHPTSPQGGPACPHLPKNSADITLALHNTHLGGQHYRPQLSSLPPYRNNHFHHHEQQAQQQYQQPPYMEHPLLLKDAGVTQPLPQNSLGPLPDVVHETTEDYYCHVNRMLRSAHFERLKRVREAGHSAAFIGDVHD